MATAVSGPATIGKAVPRVGQDAWSGHDTNPDAIDTALRRLLRERHAASRRSRRHRVLNLVVVAERARKDVIAKRLERVGRYEASRTILCTVDEERRTLDATCEHMAALSTRAGNARRDHRDRGPAASPESSTRRRSPQGEGDSAGASSGGRLRARSARVRRAALFADLLKGGRLSRRQLGGRLRARSARVPPCVPEPG